MKLLSVLIVLFCCAISLSAQSSGSFDIATFTTPAIWKTENRGDSFAISDAGQKGFCLMVVYASSKTTGNVERDFEAAWQAHAVEKLGIRSKPQTEPARKSDGWTFILGAAQGQNDSGTFAALIMTATGFGKTISSAVIFSDEAYMPAIEQFLGSLKLDANAKPAMQVQNIVKPIQAAANASGITKSKTTFDDGWTAEIDADFVHLSKGQVDVYLFYPFLFTDETRSLDTADFSWQTMVVPRFNIASATKFEDPVPDFIERLYYIEGTGTEKRTGRSGFIAMKAVTGSGADNVIVALAPTKAAYQQMFPTPKDLSKMIAANRFALSAADLIGNWNGMEGNSLMYYSTNTGNYAGMSTVAVSDRFIFNATGSYQSIHAQGSTQLGVTSGGRQEYSGRLSATDWELTLTNRYGGKTEVFSGYFEAVKGGRVLHLTNKAATGIQFHLGRSR